MDFLGLVKAIVPVVVHIIAPIVQQVFRPVVQAVQHLFSSSTTSTSPGNTPSSMATGSAAPPSIAEQLEREREREAAEKRQQIIARKAKQFDEDVSQSPASGYVSRADIVREPQKAAYNAGFPSKDVATPVGLDLHWLLNPEAQKVLQAARIIPGVVDAARRGTISPYAAFSFLLADGISLSSEAISQVLEQRGQRSPSAYEMSVKHLEKERQNAIAWLIELNGGVLNPDWVDQDLGTLHAQIKDHLPGAITRLSGVKVATNKESLSELQQIYQRTKAYLLGVKIQIREVATATASQHRDLTTNSLRNGPRKSWAEVVKDTQQAVPEITRTDALSLDEAEKLLGKLRYRAQAIPILFYTWRTNNKTPYAYEELVNKTPAALQELINNAEFQEDAEKAFQIATIIVPHQSPVEKLENLSNEEIVELTFSIMQSIDYDYHNRDLLKIPQAGYPKALVLPSNPKLRAIALNIINDMRSLQTRARTDTSLRGLLNERIEALHAGPIIISLATGLPMGWAAVTAWKADEPLGGGVLPDSSSKKDSKTLPEYQDADIPSAKFEKFSLNPKHPKNEDKWKGFDALGYDVTTTEGRQKGAEDIISQLKAKLPDASAIEGHPTPYGTKFEVRIEIVGPNGKHGTLVTVWQIDIGQTAPKLITNWVEVHK